MSELNPFYSAKCTPQAIEKMQKIREAFKTLDDFLNETSNDLTTKFGKREFALAKTNLEQSSMWAIKSISHYNLEESNKN